MTVVSTQQLDKLIADYGVPETVLVTRYDHSMTYLHSILLDTDWGLFNASTISQHRTTTKAINDYLCGSLRRQLQNTYRKGRYDGEN